MRGTKLYAMFAAMFMAGAFLASSELRVYAANTVGSADIINNSILSVDIKDGEVKASDIATDAVGAAELQGVTKLLFGQCKVDATEAAKIVPVGRFVVIECTISGVDSDDSVVANMNIELPCFEVINSQAFTNLVTVLLQNDNCSHDASVTQGTPIGIIVFDR